MWIYPGYLWFYNYLNHYQYFPREFILGACLIDEISGKTKIVYNPNYYGNKTQEEQRALTDRLINDYPRKITNKPISSVDEIDVESLYKETLNNINKYQEKGQSTYYFDGLKEYLERNYHLGNTKK